MIYEITLPENLEEAIDGEIDLIDLVQIEFIEDEKKEA